MRSGSSGRSKGNEALRHPANDKSTGIQLLLASAHIVAGRRKSRSTGRPSLASALSQFCQTPSPTVVGTESRNASILAAVPYWVPVIGRVADADDPIDPGGASAPTIMVVMLWWSTPPPALILKEHWPY